MNIYRFMSAPTAERDRMLKEEKRVPMSPLTTNQLAVLEWFSTRDWVPHREWICEMTTKTPRSLCKRGLLDVDHSKTTTHYRITDAGRAALGGKV